MKKETPFIDRELSWLDFNERVLDCAMDEKNPLSERLNFLGITTSNLDEFLSVRFAVAYNEGNPYYKDILSKINSFLNKQVSVYNTLMVELKKQGYKFGKLNKLDKKDNKRLLKEFRDKYYPILTPVLVRSSEDIPMIDTNSSTVYVEDVDGNMFLINIPKFLDHLILFGKDMYNLEDVVLGHLDEFFMDMKIKRTLIIRIIKDASMVLDNDSSDFIIEKMEEILQERRSSTPIVIEAIGKLDSELRDKLTSLFGVDKKHFIQCKGLVDYRRFSKQKFLYDPEMSYKKFTPDSVLDSCGRYSIFDMIDDGDILLHHPYDSYEPVVKFILHAAMDPNVVGIKQTLYRVSSIDSPIVDALCKAAENGKRVLVLVEIKARFDEENNIHVVDKLKSAGCDVILGVEHLKTHCKMCLVAYRSKNNIKIYSHIATGNYNEKTAGIYTDISYFTSKTKIGSDLVAVFNMLTGIARPTSKLMKVWYSPINLRKRLINNIDREIKLAKKGKKAEIFIKVNSVSDKEMVEKIYQAADSGVSVYVLARGICSLVPRKNLYIKSIVGRFLEHSRIYYFRNDGKEDYYISSADLLTRNLDKRIEVLYKVTDNKCVHKLSKIIKTYKKDDMNSFEMDEKGNYHRLIGSHNCHQDFIKNKKG